MAKISQGLSFTFRIGPDNKNQFAKVSVEVSEIDTELPIEEQLGKIGITLDKVWVHVKNKLDKQIETILDENN